MANRITAAALQYSKQLSKLISRFWVVYRILVLGLLAFRPETATSMAEMTTGVDTIMMINISTYLVNSLGEKYLYSDRHVMQWIKNHQPKEEKKEETEEESQG